MHAPTTENKRKHGFKKQGKDPSSKGLPSYNRGKGKGRQGSLPFHIDSKDEAKRKKKLKFLMGSSRHFRRHPVSYILLHFKKSRFSEASGTLQQVQGGQVRPKRQNKLKFLTGYSRRFRRHPVCYILLRFKKVIFQRCRGPRDPSRGGPWQPGEAKTGEKTKILDRL